MKKQIKYLVYFILPFFLACAGHESPAPLPMDDISLRVLEEQQFVSTVPYRGSTFFDMQISELLFETLIGMDHLGVPYPSLAEKWHISSDRKTYSFQIRSGIKFHNGMPLTVHDVVFTLEKVVQAKAAQFPELNFISGVADFLARSKSKIRGLRIIDDHNLEVILDQEFPAILELFSAYFTSIVPRQLAGMSEAEFSSCPIGSGPFKFIDLAPRSEAGKSFQVLSLSRHELPHRRRGTVRNIDIYFTGEPLDLQARMDFDIFQLYRSELDTIAADPDWRLANSTPNIINFLILNPKKHRFLQNVQNRRLIYRAINREQLVREVFANLANPAHMLIPMTVFGFNPNYRIEAAPIPEKPLNVSLPLLTVASMGRQQVAENLRRQLLPYGINLEIRVSNDFVDYVNREIFATDDPFLIGALPEYPSAYSFFIQFVEKEGFMNFFPRASQEIRNRIHLLPFLDPRETIAAMQAINELFESEAVYVPLYSLGSAWAFNKRIKTLLFKYNAIIDYYGLEVSHD